MSSQTGIRERVSVDMPVYGVDHHPLGRVEQVDEDDIHVGGRHLPWQEVARVEDEGIFLRQEAAQYTRERFGNSTERGRVQVMTAPGEIRVPEVEERLTVQKEQQQIGEVQVHTRIHEEQETIPVALEREEVIVQERQLPERPVGADADAAFREQRIRVPVKAERAEASTEAVVTGEVVVHKEAHIEQQQIAETVRRQWVDVDDPDDVAKQHHGRGRS